MKTGVKSLLTAAIAFAAFVLPAAEAKTPSEFAKAQEQIKAKYPEEFAKLQKLAETDLMAAMMRFRELAGEAKVMLPRGQMGERGRMQGRNSRNFRGGRQDGRGDMPGDMPGGRRGGMSGGMSGGLNVAGQLKTVADIQTKFPEEYTTVVKDLNTAEDKYEALAVKAGAQVTSPVSRSIRKIEEKDAAGFAEALNLAKTDARAAFAKLRELAEKAGVKLAVFGFREGGRNAERSGVGNQRVNPRAMMEKLRKSYPDEMKKYDELRRTDRVKANELLRELYRKLETGAVDGAVAK